MSTPLPRSGQHMAPRPWVTSLIFGVLFVFPGLAAAFIAGIGGEVEYAAWSLAWGMLGGAMLVFVWTRRYRRSHKMFCEALAPFSTVEILRGLEAEGISWEETLDLLEYLHDQRKGWSTTLGEQGKIDHTER